MISIREIAQVSLRPGEVIVSMTNFRDYILIITDRGTIYKIIHEE